MTNKFQLERTPGAPVSSEELLSDIRRVGELSQVGFVTMKLYTQHGKYDPSTARRRFGSWNAAVTKAGLRPANEINYTDQRLFENIMRLWEHYGRQPRQAELDEPPSQISIGPYRRRFRTWIEALGQFVVYANAQDDLVPVSNSDAPKNQRTRRDASLRLRFHILKRDNFSCRACGASPALKHGLLLHVDHIKPWSLGGETIEDNLQTLCETCNLGKSNVL